MQDRVLQDRVRDHLEMERSNVRIAGWPAIFLLGSRVKEGLIQKEGYSPL